MPLPVILLVDNDEDFMENARDFLEGQCEGQGKPKYKVICTKDRDKARELIEQKQVNLVLIDLRLADDDDKNDETGLNLARDTRNRSSVPKIMLSKFDDPEILRSAMRSVRGPALVIDYVRKIDGMGKILEVIEQTLMRARVFLCYAKKDLEKVEPIFSILEQEGHQPWLDVKCLFAGEDWEVAIRRILRETDFVIVCLSENSVNHRGFMRKEIKIALEMWEEKLEDDIYLIPARLEECEIKDEKLGTLHRVDLFRQNGFQQLLEAIKKGMNKRYQ